MLNNNANNLMAQMVQENKSLWCIKNAYKHDAKSCGECQAFWDKLSGSKEEVKELQALLKKHT